jgi:hypothetical protein
MDSSSVRGSWAVNLEVKRLMARVPLPPGLEPCWAYEALWSRLVDVSSRYWVTAVEEQILYGTTITPKPPEVLYLEAMAKVSWEDEGG